MVGFLVGQPSPLYLALPYGRFSPSGKAFAPLQYWCLQLRIHHAYRLTSLCVSAGTFRKHASLWRLLTPHTFRSVAPYLVTRNAKRLLERCLQKAVLLHRCIQKSVKAYLADCLHVYTRQNLYTFHHGESGERKHE